MPQHTHPAKSCGSRTRQRHWCSNPKPPAAMMLIHSPRGFCSDFYVFKCAQMAAVTHALIFGIRQHSFATDTAGQMCGSSKFGLGRIATNWAHGKGSAGGSERGSDWIVGSWPRSEASRTTVGKSPIHKQTLLDTRAVTNSYRGRPELRRCSAS